MVPKASQSRAQNQHSYATIPRYFDRTSDAKLLFFVCFRSRPALDLIVRLLLTYHSWGETLFVELGKGSEIASNKLSKLYKNRSNIMSTINQSKSKAQPKTNNHQTSFKM